MNIQTAQYVEVDDILTDGLIEEFNQDDLPWSFGDCALSLISRNELRNWINGVASDNNEIDTVASLERLDALPEGTLISL